MPRPRPAPDDALNEASPDEKLEADDPEADRWQLEQRIRHAENMLRVSGASG